jgi:hypothetical protein
MCATSSSFIYDLSCEIHAELRVHRVMGDDIHAAFPGRAVADMTGWSSIITLAHHLLVPPTVGALLGIVVGSVPPLHALIVGFHSCAAMAFQWSACHAASADRS